MRVVVSSGSITLLEGSTQFDSMEREPEITLEASIEKGFSVEHLRNISKKFDFWCVLTKRKFLDLAENWKRERNEHLTENN